MTVAVLAVPPGVRTLRPFAEALRAAHPSWEQVPVWAGDPQLRPALDLGPVRSRWHDPDVAELDRAQVEPDARAWLVGLTALLELLGRRRRPPVDARAGGAVVFVVGASAVLGDLSDLVPQTADEMVLVPRADAPIPADRARPTLHDLDEAGAWSTSVVGFGADTMPAIRWILDTVLATEPLIMSQVVAAAARWFPYRATTDPSIGASAWRWGAGHPALVDAPNFDPSTPWLIDPEYGPPRISLSDGDRRAALDLASRQLDRGEPLRLPGGLELDAVARVAIRRARAAGRRVPHEPWGRAKEFRAWMDREYWSALVASRPDLVQTFPHPAGLDAERFRRWAERAAASGEAPLMVDPGALVGVERIERTGMRTDGINVVGYHRHQSGIASYGRRMIEVMDRGGVPHATIAYERSWNPRLDPAPVCDQRADFATTVAFVNGDEFPFLRRDHPVLFEPGCRVVGYWFWELETLRGAKPVGVGDVDEIWVATRFVARAFEELGTVPVRVVPLPIAEPVRSDRARESFAPLARSADRFVFGVVLDHLSITARKNPLGAIAAFRAAFDPGAGPLLVIKTLNGELRWRDHERLLAAAAGHDDIVVWDEHLAHGDHMAFIGALDCLVSLHRSEGLGLHLGEAMWMGVPVIATRYSGNLDFMDDDCAVLIDADIVPVRDGDWAYPASAWWAEPDVAAAANAMRTLAADPDRAARIGAAGRRRMGEQPGEPEVAAHIATLLELT